jgi:hypothetical protein
VNGQSGYGCSRISIGGTIGGVEEEEEHVEASSCTPAIPSNMEYSNRARVIIAVPSSTGTISTVKSTVLEKKPTRPTQLTQLTQLAQLRASGAWLR